MKLVEDWATHLRKAWSIRLAGIAGVVGAYFVAYPRELERLTDLLPEAYRGPVSVIAGIFIFSTAATTRLVQQPPKAAGKSEDDGDAAREP